MPVELRTQRDGTLRDFWYGRYEVNGRRHRVNLGIKVAGTPPASGSLRADGDPAFERSRAAAMAKLAGLVEASRTTRNAERLVEQLYEIKTGEAIRSVRLDELPDEWASIARKRKPNERYASQCRSTLKRFGGFVRHANSQAVEIAQVTRTVARTFLAAEAQRGITAKTWNDTLKLLRATFKHLLPTGAINPFSGLPTRETATVFRKPFSPEQLKAIVDTAQADEFIRPILVTGICTAMRRGDCCLLAWPEVDLAQRFITVKTAKTGQTVTIPIFPMLQEELQRIADGLAPNAERAGYVFPEQARMYLENPDGITRRVKQVLARSLGGAAVAGANPALPEVSAAEAQKRGEAYLAQLPAGDKQARMESVLKFYHAGKSIAAVMVLAQVSRGSVSGYLNEIQQAIGCRIVRGPGASLAVRPKADPGLLSVARPGGKRRASVHDFHSFRVTWVTLALTAGVSLELVQKVTGHQTTDIVLKHYFQPGREAFRQALQAAMPKLLTQGSPSLGESRDDAMRKILERSTAKTWPRDRARLLKLLATR